MFDVNFDNYDFNDLLEFIDTSIEHQRHSYILTCNVDHVIKLRKDDEFRKVYSDAGAVVADGMPIIWASKLLKKPLKQKVSGSDLFTRLGEAFEDRGYRLFFLGAADGIPEKAMLNLQESYPNMMWWAAILLLMALRKTKRRTDTLSSCSKRLAQTSFL